MPGKAAGNKPQEHEGPGEEGCKPGEGAVQLSVDLEMQYLPPQIVPIISSCNSTNFRKDQQEKFLGWEAPCPAPPSTADPLPASPCLAPWAFFYLMAAGREYVDLSHNLSSNSERRFHGGLSKWFGIHGAARASANVTDLAWTF